MSEQWVYSAGSHGVRAPAVATPTAGEPSGGAAWHAPEAAPGAHGQRLGGGTIAAVVLGGLLLFVLGGVSGAATTVLVFNSEPDALTVGADGDVRLFDLAVGDCGNGLLVAGGTWAADDAVPCEAAHDFEVYASAQVPAETADRYPDEEALAIYGDGLCFVLFEPYVGRDWWHSALDFEVLVPTRQAWAGGQRSIECALSRFDQPLVGSARDSGW
jgi:hypothetical protein